MSQKFQLLKRPFFNSCSDGKIRTYATTQELKSKTFNLNNKNIKQEIGIELAFTLETRIENQHFSQEIQQFLS